MSDFKHVRFSELISEKPRNGLYKGKQFQGKGHRWVKMNEVYGNDFFLEQETELLKVTESEINRFNCQSGDLLFGRTSLTLEGIGDCLLVGDVNDVPIFESNLFRIRLDLDKAYPLFYYYFFKSKAGKLLIQTIAKQTAATSITSTDLITLLVPYYSVDIQKDISDKIYLLDKKIELNRRTNQTLEQIAQAIFKNWFVDFEPTRSKIIVKQKGGNKLAQELAAQAVICGAITLHKLAELEDGVLGIEKELHPLITKRFPNEGSFDFWQPQQLAAIAALFPNSLVDSELGEVPEGWGAKPLGDYLEIKRGGSPRPIKEYIVDKGIPWTKIADATKEPSPFLFKTKECIREEGLNKTVFLKKGTMILSNSATPGLPKFLELDACIHDGWLHFPQKKLFSDIYLYQLFLEIRKVLVAQGNGSVFTNLKTDILRNQVVVVPSQEVIDQFDTNVALIFKALKQNCKESNMLAETREILLSKLLSGELAAL